jgi:protein SCO1/2
MKNRYWIVVIALAAVGGVAGVFVGRMLAKPAVASLESGTQLPEARALGAFSLLDTRGAAISANELRGHPTLVFFGFTHCPDVCPTTLAMLAMVQKQVAGLDPRLAGLKVALITVDPERDSPEQLGRYVQSFGADFIGLTGSPPEIVNVTRSFGVAFARVDLPGGNYTMDHSATVFALDTQGRIVAVFTPPLSVPKMSRDLERLQPLLTAP